MIDTHQQALSPLVTVSAYAILFGVSYSPATYVSLLPLTFGVILACSSDISISNVFGLICAFGSTLVFVSQNIFFKKIMPTDSHGVSEPKFNKIHLLFFSSALAFLLMVPLWLYSDASRIFQHHSDTSRIGTGALATYFTLNGIVNFAQTSLAFAILSSTSPVTYSIASLIKRIAVICMAIVWFKQAVYPMQAVGICLTGVGLWMYNNAKRDVEKGERKLRQVEALREGVLPTSLGREETMAYTDLSDISSRKHMHASPLPAYTETVDTAFSSTFRPVPFNMPPYEGVPAPRKTVVFNDGPYPSPPESAESSPPQLSAQHARQRRVSDAVADDNFHLPPMAQPFPIFSSAGARLSSASVPAGGP